MTQMMTGACTTGYLFISRGRRRRAGMHAIHRRPLNHRARSRSNCDKRCKWDKMRFFLRFFPTMGKFTASAATHLAHARTGHAADICPGGKKRAKYWLKVNWKRNKHNSKAVQLLHIKDTILVGLAGATLSVKSDSRGEEETCGSLGSLSSSHSLGEEAGQWRSFPDLLQSHQVGRGLFTKN